MKALLCSFENSLGHLSPSSEHQLYFSKITPPKDCDIFN